MSYFAPYTRAQSNLLQRAGWPDSPLTSNQAGVLAGTLLLATLVFPMGADYGGRPVWAAQTLSRAPAGVVPLLLTLWAMGVAAIIAGAALRRRALSVGYLVLATLAVILIIALVGQSSPRGGFGRGSAAGALALLRVLALVAFLIVTGVRLRLPANNPTCIAQIVISIILALLMVVFFLQNVAALANMPRGTPGAVRLMVIGGLPTALLLGLAGVLSTVNGFEFRSGDESLTRTARILVISVLLTILAFFLLRRVMTDTGGGGVLGLPHTGSLFLGLAFVGLAILLLEGFTSFISEAGGAALQRAGANGGTSPGQLDLAPLYPMTGPALSTPVPGPRVPAHLAGPPMGPRRGGPGMGPPAGGPPRRPLRL